MNRIINFLIIFLAINSLSGCSFEKEKENKNDELAFKIVRDKYLKNPTFSVAKIYQEEDFIITYVDKSLVVLKEFAGTWQEYYKIDFGKQLQIYDEHEINELKGDVLIYILTINQGSSFGTAYYTAYSLRENKAYTIEASGRHGAYNDISIPSELQNRRKEILAFLEKKISESKYTYVPQNNDLDNNLAQNAVKEWNIANEGIHQRLDARTNQWQNLKIKKFNTSDLKSFFSGDLKSNFNQFSKWEFENNFYTITSFFKGSIYVYDKNERKSFVVWVPESVYGWVEKIDFSDSHSIFLFKGNAPEYRIDLRNLRIMKLQK